MGGFQSTRGEENAVIGNNANWVSMNMCKTLPRKISLSHKNVNGTFGLTVTIVGPYSFLNSLNRLPSTTRAMTFLISKDWRKSVPTIPCSSEAGYNGSSGLTDGCESCQSLFDDSMDANSRILLCPLLSPDHL